MGRGHLRIGSVPCRIKILRELTDHNARFFRIPQERNRESHAVWRSTARSLRDEPFHMPC